MSTNEKLEIYRTGRVMLWLTLSDVEWDAIPASVQTKLIEAYAEMRAKDERADQVRHVARLR